MTPDEYLAKLNERRQSLTGIQRVWADFNMEMEILQFRDDPEVLEMAIEDCVKIIADLEQRSQTQETADALECKHNQLADLKRMLAEKSN